MNVKKILLLLFSTLFISSCNNGLIATSKSSFYFDTAITCNIFSNVDGDQFIPKIDNIFYEYNRLLDNFNSYNDLININYINEHKNEEIIVSRELYDVLDFAIEMMEITSGYFNPFVGNLTNIYRSINPSNPHIDENEILKEINNLKQTQLILDNTNLSIILTGEGTIDLGAIAKGYVLNLIKDYLKQNNLTYYLINMGSSSVLLGEKPREEEGYRIQIEHNGIIYQTKNISISTSSIYQQNIAYHDEFLTHIVNPFTGSFNPKYNLVHLLGDNPALLDAFSTAFMNMEYQDIVSLSKKYHLEYFIEAKENIYRSEFFN